MSQIIDKAIVLFLKHKGRETQNIFRSVNTAVALTAAALPAEQACGEGLFFFPAGDNCSCFDMFMVKVAPGSEIQILWMHRKCISSLLLCLLISVMVLQ